MTDDADAERTPLEATPGGKWLEEQRLFDGETSELTAQEAANVWRAICERYAEQASGEVHAIVTTASPNTFFERVELPILRQGLADGRVTSLVIERSNVVVVSKGDGLTDHERQLVARLIPGMSRMRPQLARYANEWFVAGDTRHVIRYQERERVGFLSVERGFLLDGTPLIEIRAGSLVWLASQPGRSELVPVDADPVESRAIAVRCVAALEFLGSTTHLLVEVPKDDIEDGDIEDGDIEGDDIEDGDIEGDNEGG